MNKKKKSLCFTIITLLLLAVFVTSDISATNSNTNNVEISTVKDKNISGDIHIYDKKYVEQYNKEFVEEQNKYNPKKNEEKFEKTIYYDFEVGESYPVSTYYVEYSDNKECWLGGELKVDDVRLTSRNKVRVWYKGDIQ